MAGMEFPSWEVSFTLLPLQTQTKPEKLQHLGEAEFYLGQAISHQHQFHTKWQIPSPPLSLQAASAVPGCPVRGTLQVTRAPHFSHRAPCNSLCVCVWLLTGNTALLAASKNSLFIQTLHLWRRDNPVPQCCSRNSETPARNPNTSLSPKAVPTALTGAQHTWSKKTWPLGNQKLGVTFPR